MTSAIGQLTMLKRAEDALSADIDQEVVIMNQRDGKFYALDDIGRRVWEFIAEPRQVSEICDFLLAEYEVDRATCETSLLKLIEKLSNAKLVEKVAA
ncbi:MAG: PqqD family peptide modification chaperone [Propylenella sp.]